MDDEALKYWHLFSEESITDVYKASKDKLSDASPPLRYTQDKISKKKTKNYDFDHFDG